eukprot:gene3507-20917_t
MDTCRLWRANIERTAAETDSIGNESSSNAARAPAAPPPPQRKGHVIKSDKTGHATVTAKRVDDN